MEKFKIVEQFKLFNQTEAYLINMPFDLKRNESEYHERLGRLSSYHDQFENDPGWMVYNHLPPCQINFVQSNDSYKGNEAVSFMKSQGGFPLTRDNLFMLPFFFKEKLLKFRAMYAFMEEEYLPLHNDGKKIIPFLKLKEGCNSDLDFDWYFFEDTFPSHHYFVFFSFVLPELRKKR